MDLAAAPVLARRTSWVVTVAAAAVAVALPLVGLASLLLRSQLDPHFENYRAHFVVFGLTGGLAFALGFAAGEAAERRADARVLLLSLAFMATGGFMLLHAIGTHEVLFMHQHAGFQIAISVGLLVSAVFASASAFVDLRPEVGPWLIRNRGYLRASILLAMAAWFVWTLTDLPPLGAPESEAARGSFLAILAFIGSGVYAVSAARYWRLFRSSRKLLLGAVTACFVLLAEAMVGVALTGERAWHASWWEWHGLVVSAYLVIGFAARREWREERFRALYLPTTRERRRDVSVLFADLVGFTAFVERETPTGAAAVLDAYWSVAAPLLSRRFGGDVEKFIGDAIMATFNSRGDQPDHAVRAARAALELRGQAERLAAEHPEWPRLRIGVNSGEAVQREVGGAGHVAYPLVGDTVNTGARLESLAPPGGILIGRATFERLPDGAVVEERPGLRMKGKTGIVDAYLLVALP
ncbi:MAG TPA: adenylate/guanylate cyclase domain-containing protein [Gaiellaceae bacterium]|nr:adenylate/guanylate cyclase domain-containing protein [Gaiellaceae bacterium]